jgi:hypothetical protein
VTRTILLTEICHLSCNEISFLCRQVEESNPELHKALLDVQHFLLFKSDDISAEKVSNMSLDDTVDTGNESTNATLNGNSYDMEMEEVEAKIVRTSLATSSSIPVRSRSESLGIRKRKKRIEMLAYYQVTKSCNNCCYRPEICNFEHDNSLFICDKGDKFVISKKFGTLSARGSPILFT